MITEIETTGELAGHQKGRAEKGNLRIETVSVSVNLNVIATVTATMTAIETGTRAIENEKQDLIKSRRQKIHRNRLKSNSVARIRMTWAPAPSLRLPR